MNVSVNVTATLVEQLSTKLGVGAVGISEQLTVIALDNSVTNCGALLSITVIVCT